MKRGDVVVATAIGGFGKKPRPYVVVQSNDVVSERVLLVGCTTAADVNSPSYWPRLVPSTANGLDRPSEVMVDNIVTAYRKSIAQVVGRLSDAELDAIDAALVLVLGLIAR